MYTIYSTSIITITFTGTRLNTKKKRTQSFIFGNYLLYLLRCCS
jgi:hypothetical protein